MKSPVFRRLSTHVVFAAVTAATTVGTVASQASIASAARTKATKYLVCHRTNAIKNPYRLISVAWSSVDGNSNGHDNPVHDGPVFNVLAPAATHGTTPRDSGLAGNAGGGNDHWGDIFEASRQNGTGGNYNSNNWTTAGQAIFNGATFTLNGVTKPACRKMSATEYITSEREENPTKPLTDIMGELDDQESSEDAALKKALGGSFKTWFDNLPNPKPTDPTALNTMLDQKAPKVTTENPTNVANLAGTLNGTVTPSSVPMIWYFEWQEGSPTLSTPNETSPSSTITTSQSISSPLTGLVAGKTYYYRTVGVASEGTGDSLVETYLYGEIKQFTFTSTGASATAPSGSTGTTTPNSSTGSTPGSTTPGSATTTAPPTKTVSPDVGRVIGVAWFDINKNDKRENNEPLLASLPIDLTPTGVSAQGTNRVSASAYSLTTGVDGSFDFTVVPPGKYQILGDLPSGFGIDKSWDSSGNSDWTVNVTVVASKISRGDFAAIGNATVTGCYSGTTGATDVGATWSGFDSTLGTADDTTFASTISEDCKFGLGGLPTGKFNVRALSAAGQVVAESTMDITETGGALDANGLVATAEYNKPMVASGSTQMWVLFLTGLVAIASGSTMSATSRRRRLIEK